MKTNALISTLLCLLLSVATYAQTVVTDTTLYIDNKRIDILDDGERTKVKVYEKEGNEAYTSSDLVFEGHYRGGKSHERRHINAIHIPLPAWNKHFSSHWAGLGLGFANFADGSLHINDIDGVSLRSENSFEVNFNFLEKGFIISRQGWAIVTGVGMRWNRYRVDTNHHFQEIDGITQLVPAPEGIQYSKSRLNTTSLTVPILLEWQQRNRRGNSGLFVSAGVVGVLKTISSSKIEFRDNGKKRKDKMDRGMNIRPVTMDFLVQAGYKRIGLYAKYSPLTLFSGDKGPKVHPVSLGVHFHL